LVIERKKPLKRIMHEVGGISAKEEFCQIGSSFTPPPSLLPKVLFTIG
jgi:hypothetical protein